MKMKEAPLLDVGVIIGRFQVNDLHNEHIKLIQFVCDRHQKVILFLGLSAVRGGINNPLDFEARKQMVLDKFPNINVLYIKDTKYDKVWSNNLDKQISDLISPNQTVMLYGSRDCFIKGYNGRFPTTELVQETYISGTEIRKSISKSVKDTPEFRAGVIWQSYNTYPSTYATVDIAVLNDDKTKVLLARKPDEYQYRFIGGFSDPDSDSFELDAIREVSEEASIEIGDVKYIGSYKIDDWRYRQEKNKIKTLFFTAKYVFGRPEAKDDIAEVKYFNLNDIKFEDIVDTHVPLMRALAEELNNKKLIKEMKDTDNSDLDDEEK
jgi:bifunctional NMN adenylyltransferase/nudix hydrolase